MRFPYFRYAASLIVAAGIFAGCGGGGKSLVPGGSSQQSLGQSVPVTFTVTIGSQSQTQSKTRSPQFIPSNTQSIVIDYIGDNPSATPAPGATPPANVTTAATVNVTPTTTNPPPAGECFASNGTYTCTISLKLPVGVIDLYVLAYAGQNGTGLLLAGNVVIAQVNANGTVTQPGGTAPISIALVQKGVQVGTASLGSNATIVPSGIAKPSVAAPSYPTNTAPYVYTAAETVAVSNPSGTPIPAGTPISSITVTDNESSGASCLVYIPNGATTATPCPFATSASSVTLSTSGDSYALLYNGKFAPAGSISITGSVAGSSTVPAPITVSITPTIFSAGTVNFPGYGPSGSMVYDSLNKNIYVATASGTAPLYKIAYSSTTGYGTPSAVNVTSSNGSGATGLLETDTPGGINAMVIGPDNNIWFIEHAGRDETPQYVGVAAINSSVINPTNGATISAGTGVFAEYAIGATAGPGRGGSTPALHSIASSGGFIWVMDKDGDLWRINPTTGLVSPNLAANYTPGASMNLASNVTDPTGATQISGGQYRQVSFSPLFAFGSSLYVANYNFGSLDTLTLDPSATPSTGLCTPSGPPPCIATYTRTALGQLGEPLYGGGTDGTNMYVINGNTGNVVKVTTAGVTTTSTGAYSNYLGGVGISSDGWLWTLNDNGVEGLKGITSSVLVDPAAVSVCESGGNGLKRGAIPFMIGPDGTFLFTPTQQDSAGISAAVLCAVVY